MKILHQHTLHAKKPSLTDYTRLEKMSAKPFSSKKLHLTEKTVFTTGLPHTP